jgi:low temperature requirement protein LtrA
MRGIPMPDREEDFTADPSELFFDLAFVFAFSRLVVHLVDHPDWTGVGQFALLFMMIWLPWSQYTWSANAVAGNSRPVRFLFLVATAASIPMAGSINAAFGAGAPAFAISVSIILAMALFTMIVATADEPEIRASIVRYTIPNAIAVVVIIGGAFLDGRARVVAWIAAIAIVGWGTIRAGRSAWVVRAGHFAERHGLIIIVALGEVIVALGAPVVGALEDDSGLPGRTVVALAAAGAFAGLMWWGYFDRPNPAIEHRHDTLDDPVLKGRFARDVYTYSHLPLVAGIILAAAALEEITLHPDEALALPFRWMLFAGLALYLGAVVIFIARAFGLVAFERLATIPVLLVVVLGAGSVDGITLLIVVDVVLVVMLVVEHLRVEHRFRGQATVGAPAGS